METHRLSVHSRNSQIDTKQALIKDALRGTCSIALATRSLPPLNLICKVKSASMSSGFNPGEVHSSY
jgi:hypothetical protein